MKKILLLPAVGIILFPCFTNSCSKKTNNEIKINFEKSGIVNYEKEDYSEIYLNFIKIKNFNIDDFSFYNLTTNESLEFNKDLSYLDYQNNVMKIAFYKNIEKDNIINVKTKKSNIEFQINNFKTFKDFDINLDKQYFFDLVNDIANNQIPTILDSRNASLVIQQNFIISLINYYKNLNNNNTNDKTFFLVQDDIVDSNRFIKETLIENNIWDGITDIDQIIDTNKNFYLFQKFENVNKITVDDFINYYKSIIEKFNFESKFDLVIPDLNFKNLLINFEQNSNKNELLFLLKHVNKIIVTSDGSAHTYAFVTYMTEKMKNFNNIYTREKTISKLNNFINKEGEVDLLTWDDILNLLLLKNFEINNPNSKFDFISFINYDSNIFNTLNLFDKQKWNEYSFSTNFVEYKGLIKDENESNNFLNTYSKLFINSFNKEDIILSGIENYDENKRNAIFIGSSLFKPISGDLSIDNFSRLQNFENLRNVVQNKIKKLLEKFPENEFNIMFKLHPFYTNIEIAKKYVEIITGGLINNPIIINPTIPLETWISNDFYLSAQEPLKNNSIIFRENENYKKYEWTAFFGLQPTSTTIQTTRYFYQTTFGLSKYDVANLIPFSNFPLPDEYPIVQRLNEDKTGGFLEDNINELMKIYGIFCPSIIYKNPKLEDYDSIILNFD